MSTQTQQVIDKKEIYRHRIADTVNQIINEDEFFREELGFDNAVDYVTEVLSRLPLSEFDDFTDGELKECAEGLMADKLAFGLLSDLTPEEMKIFDDAVAGRY